MDGPRNTALMESTTEHVRTIARLEDERQASLNQRVQAPFLRSGSSSRCTTYRERVPRYPMVRCWS
jgi:hypothetical protein